MFPIAEAMMKREFLLGSHLAVGGMSIYGKRQCIVSQTHSKVAIDVAKLGTLKDYTTHEGEIASRNGRSFPR